MTERTWTLQDAKNRFSAVVEAARRGQPQLVTRRREPAVVVLSFEEYARLRKLEEQAAPSLVDYLLAMPSDDESFDKLDLELRDPAL